MNKLLVPLLFVPLIMACGGGSSEPPIGPLTASLSAVPAVFDEGANVTVTYSVTNVKSTANVSLVSTNNSLIVSNSSSGSYTLTANEVDREVKGKLTFVVRDGVDQNRTVTQDYNFTIKNNSFDGAKADIVFLLANKQRVADLPDERIMRDVLDEISLLNNEAQLRVTTNSDFPSGTQVAALIDAIPYDVYLNSDIGDAEVIAAYQQALQAVAEHTASAAQILDAGFASVSLLLPKAITVGDFNIDASTGVTSFFIGKDDYGQFVDGEWQYNADSTFLASLTDASCAL
ncbi:hypothetical protein [Rheinheimera maricola]|uniref:Uncharacterized protein n=1 Tax=Rheinheimera maricola TaxID=2793282 RepID=A0ABS7X5F0_9GAMM|nr:hypothetical protein [Rheinheimera maricola]MBZ9610765.1 hypothetical protein [Rheinheimera maricola]